MTMKIHNKTGHNIAYFWNAEGEIELTEVLEKTSYNILRDGMVLTSGKTCSPPKKSRWRK